MSAAPGPYRANLNSHDYGATDYWEIVSAGGLRIACVGDDEHPTTADDARLLAASWSMREALLLLRDGSPAQHRQWCADHNIVGWDQYHVYPSEWWRLAIVRAALREADGEGRA